MLPLNKSFIPEELPYFEGSVYIYKYICMKLETFWESQTFPLTTTLGHNVFIVEISELSQVTQSAIPRNTATNFYVKTWDTIMPSYVVIPRLPQFSVSNKQ